MQATYLKKHTVVEDPPIARALFNDTRWAWIWLPVRLFLALEWITAGLHKLFIYKPNPNDYFGVNGTWGGINPAWLVTGEGLKGFWVRAAALGDPAKGTTAPITFDWYRSFLQFLIDTQSYTWFAKLIVFGELAVGLGILVGALVGIAAFFGATMNLSFLLAGTSSTNPVLLVLAIVLVLAWKTAGWYGLDRYLLPLLGTPWKTVETEATTTVNPKPGAVLLS